MDEMTLLEDFAVRQGDLQCRTDRTTSNPVPLDERRKDCCDPAELRSEIVSA